MKLLNIIAPLLRFRDLAIEDEDERMCVLTRTALLSGGSTHIVLLCVFYAMDVPEMVYYNVLSVVWWIGAFLWHIRTNRWYWPLACLWPEFLIHAILATWYVGWGAAYWMYCVIMLAAMSLLPRAKWVSAVAAVFTVTLFASWYLWFDTFEPKYQLDPEIIRIKFALNSSATIGFMVLTINLAVLLQQRAWQIVEQLRAISEKERQTVEATLLDLQNTQAQLIQQEKLASLGKLTAGIAHEIKNPLNFVTNFASLSKELTHDLCEAIENNDTIEDVLDDLVKNADRIYWHGHRANEIVKNMMQHASNNQGERKRTDLNALIQQHVDLAYHGKRVDAPEIKVSIQQKLGQDIGEVEVVSQEIGRVLLNLIGNAFDAVCDYAATDKHGTYKPLVVVSTRRIDHFVEVRIADNGPGISYEIQDKVFEPFFTTKPPGSGTGLGLSLSHEIVNQRHEGTLTVESHPGQGATFIMKLPASMRSVPELV